jgi:hypothetical protein
VGKEKGNVTEYYFVSEGLVWGIREEQILNVTLL